MIKVKNKDQAFAYSLKQYQKKGSFDVVEFAKKLGLKVYTTDDLEENQSGAIVKEKDGFVIYINQYHNSKRQRFTIAHELGHYFLHRDNFKKENQGIVDSIKIASSAPYLSRKKGKSGKEEAQANEFAANLLMPRELFIKEYKACETIEEVAQKFNVSVESVAVRANNIFN
jgi:Zn-dependent peptidase ImmA (M78 family)